MNNISRAILNSPQLYTQTLHLMNKMNFPPPFDDNSEESNESESELEESQYETQVKQINQNNTNVMKRKRKSAKNLKIGFLGEKAENVETKKRKVESNNKLKTRKESVFESFVTHLKNNIQINIVSNNLNEMNKCNEMIESNCGFGVIESQHKERNNENCDKSVDEYDMTNFISDEELQNNRLTSDKMSEYSVFKDYNRGAPSVRLYVKNISKRVEEKEMFRIYGKYIDWKCENERNMFVVIVVIICLFIY